LPKPYPTAADAQPNFAQALQQALEPMDKKMDKLTNNVQKLMDDVQAIKKAQEHIRRISAIVSCNAVPPSSFLNVTHLQLYNRSQGSGDDAALEIVPLENGEDPTKPPVWLLCLLGSGTRVDQLISTTCQH
jgi:hypothetical protein